MPRFYCADALVTGQTLMLPAGAARHVQVLRLQPGSQITLFGGAPGQLPGEFDATVMHMGRSDVQVQVGSHHPTQREPALAIHLAVGMPANDRMDWLVEKATELGVASIQPLMTERSVLRLTGERAVKKVAHWQSVAIASCEQCGANRVPTVHLIQTLQQWLAASDESAPTQCPPTGTAPSELASPTPFGGTHKWLLSLAPGNAPLGERRSTDVSGPILFLSGPEGGLSPAEERAALRAGFLATSLGARVLRSETAAIAALAALVI